MLSCTFPFLTKKNNYILNYRLKELTPYKTTKLNLCVLIIKWQLFTQLKCIKWNADFNLTID